MSRYCLISYAVAILLFGAGGLSAQDLTCSAVVERSLTAIAENCAELERDTACLAREPVAARFVVDEDAASTALAERPSIIEMTRLATGGLDLDAGGFGLAFVQLGAHQPQTYAGPGILLLLAGDAAVVNEVPPESVMSIGAPLHTVALYETTRYRLPGVIPEPVGTLAADIILPVDAYDSSGDWLRAVDDGIITWVEADQLARLKAMDDLPRLRLGDAFPFQSLTLATATALPECDEAASMVAIQTPADMPISLTINGVDIHIGSLVTFQQVHRNALSMTVYRGEVTTIFGGSVGAGETVLGILSQNAQVVQWSGALPASEAELARGGRAQAAFNQLARANGWAEHSTSFKPPPVIHVVEPGEGLYRIAEYYNTSAAEIMTANELERPLILRPGQELVIPNPDSGFVGLYSAPPSDAP